MSKLSKAVAAAGTLTGALSCAAKMQAGGTCEKAEMRAVIRTLRTAYLAAKAGKKAVEGERDRANDMIRSLLANVGR